MTEKELTKLEEELNTEEVIPKWFEVEYLKENLEANIKEKYKLKILKKVYKKLRDDDQLKKILESLKKTLDMIEVIEERLKELGEN